MAAGITPSPRRETSCATQPGDAGGGDLPAESRLNAWSTDIPVTEPPSAPDRQTTSHAAWLGVEDESEVLLYTLLMVPDGRNFSCGSTKAPSVYLNCKLFWSDAIARSVVSWGQANPSFHFVQVGTGTILNKSKTVHFLYSVLCFGVFLTPPTVSFCLR